MRKLLDRWNRPDEPVEAVGRTHVGKVREINEDRLLVRTDRDLWAVADGMGGHVGGTAAANAAIEALECLANGPEPISDDTVLAALAQANEAIYASRETTGGLSGTTVVVARREGCRITVYWAGDSRAYLIRGGAAQCLTRDHSVVQELLDAGLITEAGARRHPDANVVTRALGAGESLAIDRVSTPFRAGDRLLLCSDGVSRSLTPADFSDTARALGRFADALMTATLQRDGSDNASLIAVQCGPGTAGRADLGRTAVAVSPISGEHRTG